MGGKQRILVVDDEEGNRAALEHDLRKEGFEVRAAAAAKEAFAAAVRSRPALVLSDVAMPGEDGISLCRRLKADRRTAAVPVILMSGVRRDEEDQLEGLEGGADDYLPKPYGARLLAAKVRAVLRRFALPAEIKGALEAEGLSLDAGAREVLSNRRRVALTRKEFDLLTSLLGRRGEVLSIPALLETVWGYDPADYSDPNTVHVHISSLRRKLGPARAKSIVNVPGSGYRFEARA